MKNRLKQIFCLVLSCLGLSCHSGIKKTEASDLLQVIEKQQAQWKSLKITHYRYRYYSPGWAHQDIRVKVSGMEVKIEALEETRESFYPQAYRIEEVFERLKHRLKDPYLMGMRVRYHPQYGFPEEASLSYEVKPGVMADGNTGFQILEFETD